jgi:hypothetical protein
MHRLHHASPPDEKIRPVRLFRDDEPEPVRVTLKPAGHQIHLSGNAVAVALDGDQLAVPDHLVQKLLKGRPAILRDAERAHQFAQKHGMGGLFLDPL